MYCDVSDVIANHGKIPTSGETERITAFIKDADALIDSYIGCRYEVPLTSVPPLIKMVSRDLATFLELRCLYGSQSRQYLEWIETYWKQPIEILEKIARGVLSIYSLKAYYLVESRKINFEETLEEMEGEQI